jgi:CDP-glucose 4,6-dehydratase
LDSITRPLDPRGQIPLSIYGEEYCLSVKLKLGERLQALPGPILITGHTGFKGTWLTFLLEQLGVPVIGYSLAPEKDSLYERVKATRKIPEIFADIRDLEALTKFLATHKPSAIIHMAAQPLVLQSYRTPRETFEVNVMGTANLLEAASQLGTVQCVGVVTTDKVYKNQNLGKKFSEGDPLGGKDPYSASKVGTEAVVSAWRQLATLSPTPSVFSFRAGNVIGGGDFGENRLMPDLVRAKTSGVAVGIRNMSSSRPWQHVLDPLWGYMSALEFSLLGNELECINFGPLEPSLRVEEVLKIVKTKWQLEIDDKSFSHSIEAISLDLDSTYATDLLGWKPVYSQRQAILETLNWWDKVLGEKKSALFQCRDDVGAYLDSISR